jgi:hypothetical protein
LRRWFIEILPNAIKKRKPKSRTLIERVGGLFWLTTTQGFGDLPLRFLKARSLSALCTNPFFPLKFLIDRLLPNVYSFL